ncbi:MAG: hypothetical protein R2704_11955 [Microthrixaceae bacterium]
MNYSSLPADYHIARHHGRELIMVVDGGAGARQRGPGSEDIVMEEGDSIVVEAGFYYSITVGSEGMSTVTIRTGASETKLE